MNVLEGSSWTEGKGREEGDKKARSGDEWRIQAWTAMERVKSSPLTLRVFSSASYIRDPPAMSEAKPQSLE